MGTVAYLLVWGLLFMFMMRFGCGAHVMGNHGHHGHHGAGDGPLRQPSQATDPVCGMTVVPATAKSAVHEGQVWYFCSSACRDKFEADPQQYAHRSPTAPTGEPHHVA